MFYTLLLTILKSNSGSSNNKDCKSKLLKVFFFNEKNLLSNCAIISAKIIEGI